MPFQPAAVQHFDRAAMVLDQTGILQFAGGHGNTFAPYTEHAGHAVLRDFHFTRRRAVQPFQQPTGQFLLDRAMVAGDDVLRNLGQQGTGLTEHQLGQRAALFEGRTQHRRF